MTGTWQNQSAWCIVANWRARIRIPAVFDLWVRNEASSRSKKLKDFLHEVIVDGARTLATEGTTHTFLVEKIVPLKKGDEVEYVVDESMKDIIQTHVHLIQNGRGKQELLFIEFILMAKATADLVVAPS